MIFELVLRDRDGVPFDDASVFILSAAPRCLVRDPVPASAIAFGRRLAKQPAYATPSPERLYRLATHVADWRNVSDDAGPLPFSHNVIIAMMLQQPWIRRQTEDAIRILTSETT